MRQVHALQLIQAKYRDMIDSHDLPDCISHVCLRRLGGGEAGSSGSRIGVPSLLAEGFGTEGSGQTVSLSLSGQNWQMQSYKYH